MTLAEFKDTLRYLVSYWPHNFTQATVEEQMAVAWDDWKTLDHLQVKAAIKALARDGERHAPNPGMVIRKVAELELDLPDWSEVLAQLRRPLVCVSYRKAQMLAEMAPAVREFYEHLGPAQRASALSAGAFSGDSTAEAQLRGKWEAFAGRAVRERALVGLPSAGLPVLTRVNGGPRRLALPEGSEGGLT